MLIMTSIFRDDFFKCFHPLLYANQASMNLLNELEKRDKVLGLPSILSLFRNELNKFNNTGARILDSIYHMTLRLL